MKNIFKLLVVFLVTLALVACGGTNNPNNNGDNNSNNGNNNNNGEVGLELTDDTLYLITDIGTIDDKSFNQGSWEGLKQFADEEGVKPNYIQPEEQSDSAYADAIDRAVLAGAKLIVTPGYLFSNVVLEAQDRHPDVYFILVDATPNNGDFEGTYIEKIGENTVSILYRENQSGFLAGYAAVKEGFTSLGFMGGMQVPAVVAFGYGFASGADYAAKELDVDVTLRYTYLDSFNPDPQWTTMAGAWYQDGVEVIHVAAGGAGNSVMSAAETAGAAMIGVDVDQKDESESVITSAMKNLKKTVYDATKQLFNDEWQGGKALVFGVEEEGVQISDDFSRFENFTKEDYDVIYAALVEDKDGLASNLPDLNTTDDVSTIEFERVTVEVVK